LNQVQPNKKQTALQTYLQGGCFLEVVCVILTGSKRHLLKPCGIIFEIHSTTMHFKNDFA